MHVGHHGWLTKKTLGFRWSKKAKITSETIVFGETFLSVFSIFHYFLYTMRPCWWNIFSFTRFTNAFVRKKKIVMQQSKSKQKLSKGCTLFYLTSCYMKPLRITINHFFFNRYFCSQAVFLFCRFVHRAIFLFWCLDDAKNIKRGNRKRQISRNSKLQLFQKWFQSFSN